VPGQKQRFIVVGGSDKSVWTVNGVVTGNTIYGQIGVEGFYAAPATIPSPATFSICATQGTLTGCAQVTIVSQLSQQSISRPDRRAPKSTVTRPPPIN